MPRTTPLLLLLAALVLAACSTRQDVSGPAEGEPPARTLAVLPALYEPVSPADPAALDEDFLPLVLQVARASLLNALAGKGFDMVPAGSTDEAVSRLAPGNDWRNADLAELAEELGADGLVRVIVSQVRAAGNLPRDAYLVAGRVDVAEAGGGLLGPWGQISSARDLPATAEPASVAALLYETTADEPAARLVRNLAFRFGLLAANHIPSPGGGQTPPSIRLVEANTSRGSFGLGQLVAVRMLAEPGLDAWFSLGGYRTGLPLEPLDPDRPDDYAGVYRVRPEDEARGLDLVIRVESDDGERVWIEEGVLNLDGGAPDPPLDLTADPQNIGILLTWTAPAADDLARFVIQRADAKGGDYATVGASRETGWLDEDVLQESGYLYRVLAEDLAGNRSPASPPVKAVTPSRAPAPLPSTAWGTLGPGPHLVSDVTVVPADSTLRVPAGSELIFEPGAVLLVDGRLVLSGRDDLPVALSGRSWHGLVVSPGGRLVASRARMEGCEFCILAEEAEVALDRVALNGGDGGTGVELINCLDFALEGVLVNGFRNGVVLTDSRGHLAGSSIRKNAIGLTVTGGSAEVVRNDLSDNGVDVASDLPLVLRENYLGSTNPAGLRIEGPVEVVSLLTDRPPHGRVVALNLSREERGARFEEFRNAGAASFSQGRYGEATESLEQALALYADRDVALLLSYARKAQGEDPLPPLRLALQAHPDDVRLHLAVARELAGQGRTGEALDEVRQGLSRQPGNKELLDLEAVLKGGRNLP